MRWAVTHVLRVARDVRRDARFAILDTPNDRSRVFSAPEAGGRRWEFADSSKELTWPPLTWRWNVFRHSPQWDVGTSDYLQARSGSIP